MYQFTEDCLLGIPEIDAEHRQLFQLINETQELLAMNAELQTVAEHLLTHLNDYAKNHFAHEEAYMKSIHDPELKSQQQEHADFIARIGQIDIAQLDNVHLKSALEDLLEYLSRWLFRHIIGSDTLIGKFESPLAFTSKYFTDVEIIDSEHEKLFAIIGEANELIQTELLHDKFDEIVKILDELKNYTEIHFHDEEVYMEKIGYPDLDKQRRTHAAFIEKLAEINLDEVDDNQQGYLEELIAFLLNWLSVHILHMDKRIGEYAAAHNLTDVDIAQ